MRTPAEIARRRKFDFEVLRDMQCPTFQTTAYATTDDLDARRRPIEAAADAHAATKYRFLFRVPTLIGPGRFAAETEIGVDTEVTDYPLNPPNTWIISSHTPWSPHFRRGSPVCIGDEHWKEKEGHITLGHLGAHIARMLNWDEKGRGAGYVGWNPDAIAHHHQHYAGRPLNPDLMYPALPAWIAGDAYEPPAQFEILRPGRRTDTWPPRTGPMDFERL